MENPTFSDSDLVRHATIGHREGDYIIFTCPLCKDYERRINWKTGKVTVKKGNNNILHYGSAAPVSVDSKAMSSN